MFVTACALEKGHIEKKMGVFPCFEFLSDGMCVHVCVQIHVYVCAHVCGGQISTLSVISQGAICPEF